MLVRRWVQDIFRYLVKLLYRVRLQINISKNKSMVCTLGFMWGDKGFVSYDILLTSKKVYYR